MPTPTLQDQALLQSLFQESFSPITNYSNGLLQIALQQRQERQALAREQQQQGFQLQRDQSQSALVMAREQKIEEMRLAGERQREKAHQEFQLKLEDAAQKRADERLKAQWDHADKEKRQQILDELKGQANQMGLPIPDSKLSQDDQAAQLNVAIGKGNAEKAMNLIESGKKLNQTFTQLTGVTDKERAAYSTQLLMADPAAKVLTADEQMRISNDPSQVFSVLARLKKDTSKSGKATAEAFREAMATSDATATSFYAQHAKNPEAVAEIKGQMDLQRIALHAALSEKNLPPGTYAHMFDGIVDEARKAQQGAAQGTASTLPLPKPRVSLSSPTQGTPGAGASDALDTSRIPSQAVNDPYGSLLAIVKQEQQQRPAGGEVFTGNSALPLGAGSSPVSDLFYDELGSAVGLKPAQVGSSVLFNSPGRQLQSRLPNDKGLTDALNAIQEPQQKALAFRVLNQIWSGPNNPAKLRLMRWFKDNAATQNAIAPTAFPSAPFADVGSGFSPGE